MVTYVQVGADQRLTTASGGTPLEPSMFADGATLSSGLGACPGHAS
jgi:hypothetical protein